MLQNHPDIKGIEWRYHCRDPDGERIQLQLRYSMRKGDSRVRTLDVDLSKLSPKARRNLDRVADWVRDQAPVGEAYMGGQEPPSRVLDQFFIHVMGEATQGDGLKAEFCVWFPGNEKEQMVPRSWAFSKVPADVEEAARRLDLIAWGLVIQDLQDRFRIPASVAKAKMPRLVYIAYRHPTGEATARRLAGFLRAKDLTVPWFDRNEMGFADGIKRAMAEGIDAASLGVVVFTSDFLDGPTAKWEHEQLWKKAGRNQGFGVGYLLVAAKFEELPRESPLSVRVESADDPAFDETASKIYRGVWGLPQEPQSRSS